MRRLPRLHRSRRRMRPVHPLPPILVRLRPIVRSITSDPKRKLLAFALAGSMLTTSLAAIAAPPQDAESVAMFDEGRRLMTKGDYAGAITQFEKIVQKTRAVGALLNL